MPLAETFRRQVDLLLSTVPFTAKEKCFALKGGTAINLFFRDLPRLPSISTSPTCACFHVPDRLGTPTRR